MAPGGSLEEGRHDLSRHRLVRAVSERIDRASARDPSVVQRLNPSPWPMTVGDIREGSAARPANERDQKGVSGVLLRSKVFRSC